MARRPAAVSPLPVSALGAGDAITGGLRRAGLKTIGDVASRGRHEITARFGAHFTTLLEQALGRGRCADQPAKAAAGLHRREALSRTGRHRHRDRDEPVRARRACWSRRWTSRARARGGWTRSFFRTDGAVRTISVDTGRPVTQSGGDRPPVPRAARRAQRSPRSRLRLRSRSACPPAAPKSWCSSSATSTPTCTTMTNWPR